MPWPQAGGSLGQTSLYTFYALFRVAGGIPMVAPLENCWQRNRARDRLDALRER